MDLYAWILTLAIVAGQLVKIPLRNGGVTPLDLAVLALCLFGLFQIRLRLIKPPYFIVFSLLFILIAFLSLILTPLHLSTNQYLSSFLYIIRFSSYILLGWLLLSKALPSLKINIDNILLTSGVVIAVLGLLQFIFLPDLRFLSAFGWDPHYFRSVSTFLDPNFVGAYFVFTLILIFRSGIFANRVNQKTFFFLIVYLALLTTFSRSSYGMFLISFLALAALKKSLKLTILTLILFGILVLSFQIYIWEINKLTPLDRRETASLRLSTWQQGLTIFLSHPIFGVGFNAYNFALREYKLGDNQFLKGHGSTFNDSSLIHVASTTGIVGFISYLLFLLTLLKNAWPKNPGFISILLGVLGHSFFVNSLFYPPILIWLILSASNIHDKQSTS